MADDKATFDEAEAHRFAASLGRAVYYAYLLRKGPAWTAEASPRLDALQKAHVANMGRLAEEGPLVLNGPLLDAFQLGGDIRGMGVLKVDSLAQAQALLASDPMVQAGHLAFELHAWMVPKGVLP